MIELFSIARDDVIKSSVAAGKVDYHFALTNIFPLIDKFDEQRKVQRRKFYERLRLDINRGCIMPPITLAFVNPGFAENLDIEQVSSFVLNNMGSGYVLDGMQRLTTLKEASADPTFVGTRSLYLNVIIAERYDLLLYRMVTLNNGQKPMTARHQIEMLTKGMLDTEHLSITIVSEKDTESVKPQGSFRRADIAAAYTAFLTNSINNDNSRIIESKLDDILVGKVMEANLTDSEVTFQQVLAQVDRLSADTSARDWLRVPNNLIGFAVGAKSSISHLTSMSRDGFGRAVETFNDAFEAIDVSKINVGKTRRELAKLFIEQIEYTADADSEELVARFFEATLVD
jgi:hypothetical protein